MAPPQTHQKNNKLAEVAEEGFALLDEFYGRGPKKSVAAPQARQKNSKLVHDYFAPHIFAVFGRICDRDWEPQVLTVRNPVRKPVRKPVINSSEAVQFYGGMEIVDHTIGKAIGRAY